MNMLFERDYSILLDSEIEEKRIVELESRGGKTRKYGKTNCYHKYPKAVRHHMSLFPNNFMDIVDLKNVDELNRQCDAFAELLENKSITELDIKRFVQNNRYYHIPAALLKNYSFGHHGAYLFKEFHIGTSYIADYVLIGDSSDGHQFVFVEFENPYNNIIIGDGNFGSTIRKGIDQVRDWKAEIESCFSEITKEFKKYSSAQLPDEFYTYDSTRMNYVVIAGRRNDFNDRARRLRRETEIESKIKILHYDNLLDVARQTIGNATY